MTHDQPLRRVWRQDQSTGAGPVRAIVRRLRRNLGEGASTLASFSAEPRSGYGMDRAKRRKQEEA